MVQKRLDRDSCEKEVFLARPLSKGCRSLGAAAASLSWLRSTLKSGAEQCQSSLCRCTERIERASRAWCWPCRCRKAWLRRVPGWRRQRGTKILRANLSLLQECPQYRCMDMQGSVSHGSLQTLLHHQDYWVQPCYLRTRSADVMVTSEAHLGGRPRVHLRITQSCGRQATKLRRIS